MYAPWKTHISSNVYEVNGSLTTKTIIMSNLLMIIRTHQAQKQPQFGWGGSYEENEENEENEEYEKNPITRSKVALREGFLQTSLDWWMDIDHWLWPETYLTHIGHTLSHIVFVQAIIIFITTVGFCCEACMYQRRNSIGLISSFWSFDFCICHRHQNYLYKKI